MVGLRASFSDILLRRICIARSNRTVCHPKLGWGICMRAAVWCFTVLLLLVIATPLRADNTMVYFEGPKTVVVPLEKSAEGKLFATVMISGVSHRFNIDTGAGSILDLALAHSLGLKLTQGTEIGYGLTGQGLPRISTRTDLHLGDLKITGMPFDCLNLKDLNRVAAEHKMPTFDGIIGADFLAYLKAVIDYQHLTLTLTLPNAKAK